MPLCFKNKPSLIVYLTCGDPKFEVTLEVALASIEAGAEVIELGVPFSDPVADGPAIQRACDRALQRGAALENVFKLATDLRSHSDAGLIIFSYLNPIMRMGLPQFAARAVDSGIDGALITDLPVEEAGAYLAAMRERNLATVFLAAPTSTNERLKRIARASTGFVYALARTGVTGARQQMSGDARELVRRLRKYTKLPIAVGFGISTAEQFAAVGEFADAAVIGSAIVETIERSPGKEAESVAQFVRQLSTASRQYSATHP